MVKAETWRLLSVAARKEKVCSLNVYIPDAEQEIAAWTKGRSR